MSQSLHPSNELTLLSKKDWSLPVAVVAVDVLDVSAHVAVHAVLEGGGKDGAPVAEGVEQEVAGLEEILNLGVLRLKSNYDQINARQETRTKEAPATTKQLSN